MVNPNRYWIEDEWMQVKHCEVCLEPMLLADYLLDGNAKKNKRGFRCSNTWRKKKTCCQKCRNDSLRAKRENKRGWFHRATFTRLVSDFREALGFPKSDTESTFGPWDLNMLDTMGDWRGLPEWDAIIDYVHDLRKEEQTMLVTGPIKASTGRLKTRRSGRDKHGSFFFLQCFYRVYRDEFHNAPLWNLSVGTKIALRKEGIEWIQLPKNVLFERMKREMYPNGLTFDDWSSLCAQDTYDGLRAEHPWMPHTKLLFYGPSDEHQWYDGHYEKIWHFVLDFRRYMCRDNGGRFTKPEFKRVDCLVSQTRGQTAYNSFQLDWTVKDMRDWFFSYLFEYYEVEVDREKFPYESSEEELESVINLRCVDIHKVRGYSRIYTRFSNGTRSIRHLVKWLWPDYKMVQTRWNRMLLSEKLMSGMLDKALTYNEIKSEYGEATSVLNADGRKARYEHSDKPVKVDFRCEELGFIVEGQGEYHYMQDEEIVERMLDKGDYVTSLFWNNKIPDCYDGEETTLLGYRQFLDRECRKIIEDNGYTPVYVILADIAHAVEGVHGDIPVWNRRYVTGDDTHNRYKFGESYGGIGLAETFDMQGREDVGDMIRKYYNEVVLA